MVISLSVVIPVKNSEETLPRCLEALHNSPSPPLEILIADDGSTDQSLKIADTYPLVRIITAEKQVNGVAQARNRGAKAARGDVILFIDSDIVVSSNVFEILHRKFDDPSVKAIVGLLSPESEYKNFASDYKNLWIHYTYLIQPRMTSLFYTSVAAIRRSLFLECGGFDEAYRSPGLEDTDFGNKLHQHGYAVHLITEIQVLHLKFYRLSDLFKLDFERAMGLVKIQFRRGVTGIKTGNLSSVPQSFILSIIPAFLCCLILVVGVIAMQPLFILVSLLAGGFSTILNIHYLSFLYRKRDLLFTITSGLFLLVDSIVLVCGAVVAIIDYLRGKRY